MHWTISVVATFLTLDLFNDILTACSGSQHASGCLVHGVVAGASHLPPVWDDILVVNVSTVQSTGLVPLRHPGSIPRELIYLPET